ncbi:unnamed protein product [Rhizoctonia solani]|uniref:Uncharacterized protein n=1 Tax=Rhizoctonia solani TaxID=456999 RepID=A0A8H3E143_9AGAM|nr:unnamed protein product [Rhizoctonia solani]
MGKPTEAVPGHLTPRGLAESTPNILVCGSPPVYLPEELRTQEASVGTCSLQGGNLDQQTRPEISTSVSGQTPTTFPQSSLLSGGGSNPPPENSVVLDARWSRVPVPAPTRRSGLARPPASAVFNRPTGVAPLERCYLPFRNSCLRPKPQVKVCVLCTGGPDLPVLQDASLILEGLARVPNIDPNHIIIRTSQLIDVALDKFFDPTDINEGALLILIISCHGLQGRDNNVLLQFKTQDGDTVDSRMLQNKIMALPKHCTLEVVVDTCYAEGVIPGLNRISTPDDPFTPFPMPAVALEFTPAHTPPSG